MPDREHIAELLRGNRQVTCIDKKTFEVSLKSPVILKLKKKTLIIGGGRKIQFSDVPSYLKGLTGMTDSAVKYDRNQLRRNTTILAKLYGDRVIKKSKKDTSFQIDKKKPSTVKLDNAGGVTILWHDGNPNVYQFDDCVKHLTEFGPEFTADRDKNGQVTQRELDDPDYVPSPAALGPNQPQPATVNVDTGKEPGKKRKKGKRRLEKDPNKREKPKGSGRQSKLGTGGKELSEDDKKKAAKATKDLKQGAAIRLLITEFDADNDTIQQIVGVDDKAVQRTRRAVLREKRKQAEG